MDYQVKFVFEGLSVKNQSDILVKLMRVLTKEERDALRLTLIDEVGGQHFFWNSTGIDPDGNKCSHCLRASCVGCPEWTGEERYNERRRKGM